MKTSTARLDKNTKRIRRQKEMSLGDLPRATEHSRAQMSNSEANKDSLS